MLVCGEEYSLVTMDFMALARLLGRLLSRWLVVKYILEQVRDLSIVFLRFSRVTYLRGKVVKEASEKGPCFGSQGARGSHRDRVGVGRVLLFGGENSLHVKVIEKLGKGDGGIDYHLRSCG